MKTKTLSPELRHNMDAYWRAANYLSVGQLYLHDNPLLKEPLKLSHVKPLVVGHWGTTPGQRLRFLSRQRLSYRRLSTSIAFVYVKRIRTASKLRSIKPFPRNPNESMDGFQLGNTDSMKAQLC